MRRIGSKRLEHPIPILVHHHHGFSIVEHFGPEPGRFGNTHGSEIRKQFGLAAAQVILGQAAADVTQVYVERDAEKAREVARLTE